MKTLIVKSDNDQDLNFLIELVNKLGFESSVIIEEDIEDAALLQAMLQEKKGDYVAEEEIIKALNSDEN